MSEMPGPIHDIGAIIDAAHERRTQGFRPHMGVSIIGNNCDRYLWLSFRWAFKPSFSGRMLRLFRRGWREEETVIQDLEAIGIVMESTQGHVNFGCHVSGSMDGIIASGVPQAPKTRHILEIKTHNERSFKTLSDGVHKAHPQHYIQMQCYMKGAKIERALYYAVNKNDDTIYTERVKYEQKVADFAIKRAQDLALAERLPAPRSISPDWYECKMCNFYDFCHQGKACTEINCRTCAHSTPEKGGAWICEKYKVQIPKDNAKNGCADHYLHPDLKQF